MGLGGLDLGGGRLGSFGFICICLVCLGVIVFVGRSREDVGGGGERKWDVYGGT